MANFRLRRKEAYWKEAVHQQNCALLSHSCNSGRCVVCRLGGELPRQERCPQRQGDVEHVVRYRSYDGIFSIVEGSKAHSLPETGLHKNI